VPNEPTSGGLVTVAGPAPELRVAVDIAQAFLTARQPTEVYRLALERVAPLVGATFACVFLRDREADLLRIVSAYNWPQRYAGYLGSMRVRSGNGPTGRAVLHNHLVDVADVFADPELEDWWESARELGFTSSIALPLSFEAIPIGALTFYFRDREALRAADRNLLRLVAHQLAATAEKAHLIDDLERANRRLIEQNADLQERYRESEETRRLKSEFLGNVSHELRTPLTAILGYAFLLKEGVTGPVGPEQATAIAKIESAGEQLLTLIDSLLDLSSLKLGTVRAEPKLCDAAALTRRAVDTMANPRPTLELTAEVPAERIPIHTDGSLVLRVLHSLIANAIKFTETGRVSVRVSTVEPEPGSTPLHSKGPEILWEVRDTGIGVDASMHEVIFDDFRQGDGSPTRRFGGTGLGLAIARGVARRLGGDIRVESELGKGACFLFSLPSSVVRAGGP